jgi:hypothetical protein
MWRGRRDEASESQPTQQEPREHAMMFAFALAIVGVVVLAAMNHAAAHAS